MIIDTSAVVAVLRAEPDAAVYTQAIEDATHRRMSAVSFCEAAVVIDSAKDPVVSRRFDDFVAVAEISVVPVTEVQARLAREAYRDFGKGSGHPARLNFGDCFAYALTKERGETLLYKGDDFTHTDVSPAVGAG